MTKYFVNILIEDREGVELPTGEVGLRECYRAAREVLMEGRRNARMWEGCKFQVVDERGQTILVIPFTKIGRLGTSPKRKIIKVQS